MNHAAFHCRLVSLRQSHRVALAVTTVSLASAVACASFGRSERALETREWRLAELGGQPAVPSTGMRRAHLRFSADAMRVTGSGGCNSLTGSYKVVADRLVFGPIQSTSMACADARLNRQETDFHFALQGTNRYEITRDTLILIHDGERLARLVGAPR